MPFLVLVMYKVVLRPKTSFLPKMISSFHPRIQDIVLPSNTVHSYIRQPDSLFVILDTLPVSPLFSGSFIVSIV